MSSAAFLARFNGATDADDNTVEESAAIAQQQLAEGGISAFINKFAGVSESHWFYDNTIEIKFDKVEHKYFRVGDLGELVLLYNVSTVSKIIDRSSALIPWAAKVTVEKMLRTIPTIPNTVDGSLVIPPMPFEKFSELAMAAKTAHKDKLEDAGDVGKMAHDFIEQYIKCLIGRDYASIQGMMNRMCPDERANSCILAALGWMKAHNVRWISTERKVYSKKHDCCGTLDGLCITDSCDNPACCPVAFKDRRSLLDWKTSNYLYIEFIYQASAYKAFYLEEFPNEVVEDIWILRLGKEDGEFQPWHLNADSFESDFEGFLACLNLKRKADELEQRMSAEKAKIRAAKKKVREEEKAREKEDQKAAKRAEREKLKAEKAAEREKLKLEAKAERARLKAEKKASKVSAITTTSAPCDSEPSEAGQVTLSGVQDHTDPAKIVGGENTKENNEEPSQPAEQPDRKAEENREPEVSHEDSESHRGTGAGNRSPEELNLAAKMERAGAVAVEETKKVYTNGLVVEEEKPSRTIFNIPTEG